MRKELFYTIGGKDEGQTVGSFLKAHGYSRHLLIALKQRSDGLTIDERLAYVIRPLKAGDVLHVKLPEETADERIIPSRMPLDIVYEDEDLLVINKDAGVPVHPSHGHQEYTLANALAWYFKEKNEPFRFRIVNRLDRDTTGLLIVARHALSACVLGAEITNRDIERIYLAASSGNVFDVFENGVGLIDEPIAEKEDEPMIREVDPERGEPARTHIRVLGYDPETDVSFLALKLDTGRTHQIRVHLSYIGHPLLGDFLYNPDMSLITRQSLHSWKLTFKHPITGKVLSFTAPIPPDLYRFVPPDCEILSK